MATFDIDILKSNLTKKITDTTMSEIIMLSKGVLSQASWFNTSIGFLLLECLNNSNIFDDNQIQTLTNIYYNYTINDNGFN